VELLDEIVDLVPETLRSRWRSASGLVAGWLILGGSGGAGAGIAFGGGGSRCG
jgi:hypothetical protein